MSEVLKVLSNIRSLRLATRDFSVEQLENLLEKIETLVSEKKVELAKAQEEENARQERIAKYKELLEKEGISVILIKLDNLRLREIFPKIDYIIHIGSSKPINTLPVVSYTEKLILSSKHSLEQIHL